MHNPEHVVLHSPIHEEEQLFPQEEEQPDEHPLPQEEEQPDEHPPEQDDVHPEEHPLPQEEEQPDVHPPEQLLQLLPSPIKARSNSSSSVSHDVNTGAKTTPAITGSVFFTAFLKKARLLNNSSLFIILEC